MGYRISLYSTPKQQVDAIRDITDKEVNETEYDVFNELTGERIKYDTLANVLDTGYEEENNLCSRIFKNRLNAEEDMSFYTISKEQLKNIIYYICQHNIYEFRQSKIVDYENRKPSEWYRRFSTGDDSVLFEASVRTLCNDYEFQTNHWKVRTNEDGQTTCLNVNLDDKWTITDGYSYDFYIFNLVYLYKVFDWENNYLVAIGG